MIRNLVRNFRVKSAQEKSSLSSSPAVQQRADEVNELPLLSVIVPCYKVEQYLAATLETILNQESVALEIIVVDDGSPDASGEIARRYAETDARVRLISQANAGLGAARNTGIREARGKYLTFADSDDYVPKGSYHAMVTQLETSGSDFVVGSVERKHGLKTWIPEWAQAVHKEDKTGAVLSDDVDILKDVFAWNKVFRRSFWDEFITEFPTDIRYEDQTPTAIAYTKSKSFDVLNKVVYTWVIREDGTSITQQKAKIEDLRDRLEVMENVSQILSQNTSRQIHAEWVIKSVGFDLKPYFDQIPRTNIEYWDTLSEGLRFLDVHMGSEEWNRIPFWERIMAQSLLHGSQNDIGLILAARHDFGTGYEVRRGIDGDLECNTDFMSEMSFRLDPKILIPSEESLRVVSELLGVRWISDHEVEVRGSAWISGLGSNNFDYDISASLHPTTLSSELERIEVPLTREKCSQEDLPIGDAYNDYSDLGFTIVIDTRKLSIPEPSKSKDLSWSVLLTLNASGIIRTSPLVRRSVLGTAASFSHGSLSGRSRIAIKFDELNGLALNVPTPKPVATTATVEGRRVVLVIDGETSEDFDRLVLRSKHHRDVSFVASSRTSQHLIFDFELPIFEETLSGSALWELRLANRHTSTLVQYGSSSAALEPSSGLGSRTRLSLSANGFLRIIEADFAVCIMDVSLEAEPETLTVSGSIDAPYASGTRIFFEGKAGNCIAAENFVLDRKSKTFTAIFKLTTETWGRQGLAHLEGGYALKATRSGTVLGAKDVWVPVSADLQNSLPRYGITQNSRIRLSRTEQAGALWMNIYAPLSSTERGRRAQRRLITREITPNGGIERESTLFESFGGSSISDSPLALFEHARENSKGGKLYWSVKDGTVAVPDGAESLIINSAKYHQVLSEAKYLVNNNNFPHYFRKSSHQFYLQTWHGTPLKKIGNDVPMANLSISYRRLMEREVASWDALVAQNEYSVGRLRQAFGFQGPIWEDGYPRNDALVNPRNSEVAQRVRNGLGISPRQHVVLYAPTWRDNVRTATNNYDLVSHLDYKKLFKAYGDSVLVLVRGHSNTIRSNRTFIEDNVIDVSSYPNINELMLASDSLITDYSSLMFDYVSTQKPIMILAPDISEYESSTRGFYYDFRNNLPGPLLRNTDQVISALNGDMFAHAYRGKHYRETFASKDDGYASSRIAAKLWK